MLKNGLFTDRFLEVYHQMFIELSLIVSFPIYPILSIFDLLTTFFKNNCILLKIKP